MQRFLWMVLRSVCSPRRKQKVEMQMARQTREMTMPTQVMTDSSSSLMRPWYWGTGAGRAQASGCTQPAVWKAWRAPATGRALQDCPLAALRAARACFLMLWKARGERTRQQLHASPRGPGSGCNRAQGWDSGPHP